MDGAFLDLADRAQMSVGSTILSLSVCAALSFLISWHFRRFGSTFSNRTKFAAVLPAIALTTALVISVVKSSLALSLGLVGALSIVRFRTPVKEPEELAYIFISIAVGLGCGANQLAVVSIAIPLILAVMSLRLFFQKTSRLPNLYLNIETPTNGDRAPLQGLVDSLSPHVANLDLRRFDDEKGRLAATFFMECQDLASVEKIREALRKRHPDSRFSFVEQSGLPGN